MLQLALLVCLEYFMSHYFENVLTKAQSLIIDYSALTTDNLSFKEKLLLAYSKQFLDKLLPLLEQDNLEGLQELLAENWQFMLINCLNYTAIPNQDISVLCCHLAASVSEALKAKGQEINPLELLMPGIETESCSDDYPDLNPSTGEELQQIIATHILGTTGNYLVPVQLLVDANFEEQSSWPNPYYNYQHPENYKYTEQDKEGCITAEERARLFTHSSETHALMSSWDRYQKLCADDESTLLGQLMILRAKLSLYNAYQGNGTQENAGGGAYGALIAFFEYFEKINPEQKESIPEAVHNEIKLIFKFLTDFKANDNATRNVQTCIADRRTALTTAMSGHEDELNQISVSETNKTQLIDQAKKQIESCKDIIKRQICENDYMGQDNLQLSQAILDTMQLSPQVNSLADSAWYFVLEFRRS